MSVESLLSYGIGFGSALILFVIQQKWRRKEEKKKLAKILEVEIEAIKKFLPFSMDKTEKMLALAGSLKGAWGLKLVYDEIDTHVYESLLRDLGVFKKETIEALRNFYGYLHVAEFWVRQNLDLYREMETLSGEKQKSRRELTKKFTKNYLRTLKEALENVDIVLTCLKEEYD